jgi:hypothetical protein
MLKYAVMFIVNMKTHVLQNLEIWGNIILLVLGRQEKWLVALLSSSMR